MVEWQDDRVLAVHPTDDVGAATQARFHYQVELASARCIQMLVEDDIFRVVCEWHEDYVVQYRTAPTELVSVKHLEPSQPRWTLPGLCEAGGLRHLFDRWRRVDGRCSCRLQTNAGLTTGSNMPGALGDACNNGDRTVLREWVAILSPLLHATNEAEVEDFLAALKFQAGLPDRQSVTDVHLNQVVRPVLRTLGMDDRDAVGVHKVICGLVAAASRSGDRHDVVAALSDPDALTSNARRRRVLESKTISKAQVLEALGADRTRPHVLLSAPAPTDRSRTRLAKKLERGGLGATGISSAARLRSNWMRLEHQWSIDLPGEQNEIDHLRQYVLHLVSQAERDVRQAGRPYAAAMQARVEELVTSSALDFDPVLPVSDLHLLGLVYEQTEACEVWWSDEFDADVAT